MSILKPSAPNGMALMFKSLGIDFSAIQSQVESTIKSVLETAQKIEAKLEKILENQSSISARLSKIEERLNDVGNNPRS